MAAPVSLKLENLKTAVEAALGERLRSAVFEKAQLIVEVAAADLLVSMQVLRDNPALAFEQVMDVTGVDYSGFGGEEVVRTGPRFAVVYQLLSVSKNWRLRVRCWCPEGDFPVVDSVISVWASANWFEREAFDLYGIVFDGHPDLRRILTDYGFVGHPFRKDFPIMGNVEMRYDPEQKRVIYQPVTIEPREIVPRVIREDNYAGRK